MSTKFELSPELRPCLRGGLPALLHGVFIASWTHGASPLIGGFSAGQETSVRAIIENEDGDLLEVPVYEVTMLDSKAKFDGFCWETEEGE
ncbi:hypothetical protein [Paraeggerthella sp.]|uniref:hypothetical protein n=1 Tax=Paraeggerthella sp. TaxID=2897350 RepID=UPI003AB39F51